MLSCSTFMDSHVYPAEQVFDEQLASCEDRWAWDSAPVLGELRAEARAARPVEPVPARRARRRADQPAVRAAGRDHRPQRPPRAGRAQLRRAGHRQHGGARSSSAPTRRRSSGSSRCSTGEIRSAFAMTEPDVASSDATNIATRIERDGDEYVINGRKWWITGAMNPNAKIFIVMGKTDPTADRHRQQSMILVAAGHPGVRDHARHARLRLRRPRPRRPCRAVTSTTSGCPADEPDRRRGRGLRHRPGPSRPGPDPPLHALDRGGRAGHRADVRARGSERVAFGKPLAEQGVVRDWIAESRVKVEQLRLLTLKAAWLMDTVGNKGAHTEIQAIKIAAPDHRPVDPRQGHPGARRRRPVPGLPPARTAFAGIRTLRFADGPDEVHKNALARSDLAPWASAGRVDECRVAAPADRRPPAGIHSKAMEPREFPYHFLK